MGYLSNSLLLCCYALAFETSMQQLDRLYNICDILIGLNLLGWLQGMTIRTADCPGQVTYSVGQVQVSVACPTRKVVISFYFLFFYWQYHNYFNSSIRFWVTVTVFVLQFHNRNISFLSHHQTDRLQCRSMWLACQCRSQSEASSLYSWRSMACTQLWCELF